uniref:Coiled-coil domain-containing protein 147 n=1 Tax=Schistosoma haematobium TaxID=6185 RepID=A0A094ZPA8_SCHHA
MNQQPNTSDVRDKSFSNYFKADVTKVTIKSAVDDETYEALKCGFDEVLRELEGNKNLEKFKEGYEKLMRAFSKSHDNEKLLMRKCRELKSEIISSSAKVAQAANISSDDPNNVTNLKREIEQAWKMVDAAADRESKAHATIKDLKEEIANLSKLLERTDADAAGSESLVELQRQKEKLLKERDEQISDNQKLREQIEETRNRVAICQNELLEAQNKITELTVDLQNKNLEAQRELRKKERMEKDLKQVRSEVEAKMGEISSTSASVEKLKQELRTKDEENRATKVSLEQANRHLQITEGKLKDCQAKLEQQIEVNESITAQMRSKTTEVKQREDEVQRAKIDYHRLLKQNELISKKYNQIEEEKLNLQHTCEQLHNEIHSYETQIELIHKTNELNKKACDELNHEKEIINKTLLKTTTQTIKQTNLIKIHELSKQNLEQEIMNYRDEALKQRQIIYKLERERDHYIMDASELTKKILTNMDELKLREMQIFENKKKIAEYETKLKQQQNLYEAIRNDRNLYNKQLIHTQNELIELKKQLKLLIQQMNQLKNDITQRDMNLIKEKLEKNKIEKSNEQLLININQLKLQINENISYIELQKNEENKLIQLINDINNERNKEKINYNQLLNERDLLGSQLIRRNDELLLLYEKLKIQQSILNKGTSKLELHSDLNTKEKAQNRQKTLYSEDSFMYRKYRVFIGSDPSTYEMIQKIQALQKRLISKTEEVVEKELLIQEKEKIYIELKHILARHPGPEVAEQLNIYQNMIRDKTKQMKAMTAEMNVYESQITEYKIEIEHLNRELQNVKKTYFKQKRRQQQMNTSSNDDDNNNDNCTNQGNKLRKYQPHIKDSQSRFTGGGFKLTHVVS